MAEPTETIDKDTPKVIFGNANSGAPSEGFGESMANPSRSEFDALSKKQQSDQNLLYTIMAGVVVFVVVTLWIELSAMHRNYAQDKTILIENNQQNKDYFDKVLFLNNEVQDLKMQLEILKARNSYLK